VRDSVRVEATSVVPDPIEGIDSSRFNDVADCSGTTSNRGEQPIEFANLRNVSGPRFITPTFYVLGLACLAFAAWVWWQFLRDLP
jgi:hypothetical protein